MVALADSTWTPAPATPPNNNVAAPINVSGGGENGTAVYSQTKTGLLGLGQFQFLPSSLITNVNGVVTGNVPVGDVQ